MVIKHQHPPFLLIITVLLLGVACKQRLTTVKNLITVHDANRPFDAMMYLNREHEYWGMIVRENTLNDTALIGIMKVPPGKTGKLFKVECFVDSIPFNYHPYRAAKGKLVIEYFSGDY